MAYASGSYTTYYSASTISSPTASPEEELRISLLPVLGYSDTMVDLTEEPPFGFQNNPRIPTSSTTRTGEVPSLSFSSPSLSSTSISSFSAPLPSGGVGSPDFEEEPESPEETTTPHLHSSSTSSSEGRTNSTRSRRRTSPPRSSVAGSLLTISGKPRRKPIPRKGHKKSRNGCYNCKRRKVKCQENLPECYNCKRIGLTCVYPPPSHVQIPVPSIAAGAASGAGGLGGPGAPINSHGSGSTFNMDDMRFFHHFLFTAYPPLPIGGSEVWHNVSSLSHSYDFLIHAMLGLAASHLTLSTGVDYSSQALSHRIAAINRLNDALSVPCSSKADGDARYATTMALTFQSSYMPDGMIDFVRMMRGCAVVARTAMPSFEDSMWGIFSEECHIEQAKRVITMGNSQGVGRGGAEAGVAGDAAAASTPVGIMLDDEVVDGYLGAVRRLAPLCVSVTEVAYLAAIERTMKVAKRSPVEAQGEFTRMYTMSNDLGNDEFISLIEPSNHGAKLLLIHVYLCEHVLSEAYLSPMLPWHHLRQEIIYHWLRRVVDSVPAELKKYGDWATTFVRERVYRPPQERQQQQQQQGSGGTNVSIVNVNFGDVAGGTNLWSLRDAGDTGPTQQMQQLGQQQDGFDASTGAEVGSTGTVGSPEEEQIHMDYGGAVSAAMEIDGVGNPFRVERGGIWDA